MTFVTMQLALLLGYQDARVPRAPEGVRVIECKSFRERYPFLLRGQTCRIFQDGEFFDATFNYEIRCRERTNGKAECGLRLWWHHKFDDNDLTQRERTIPLETGEVIPIFGELFVSSHMHSAGFLLFRVTHLVPKEYRPTQDRFCTGVSKQWPDHRPFTVTEINKKNDGKWTARIRFTKWDRRSGKYKEEFRDYRVGELVPFSGNLYQLTKIVEPRVSKLKGFDDKEFLDEYFPLPRHREFRCPGWVEFAPQPIRKK